MSGRYVGAQRGDFRKAAESVYRRYAIVNDADLLEAGRWLMGTAPF